MPFLKKSKVSFANPKLHETKLKKSLDPTQNAL